MIVADILASRMVLRIPILWSLTYKSIQRQKFFDNQSGFFQVVPFLLQ